MPLPSMEPEIDLSSIVEKLDHNRRWNSYRMIQCQMPDAIDCTN